MNGFRAVYCRVVYEHQHLGQCVTQC